jgi:hypothetical protein
MLGAHARGSPCRVICEAPCDNPDLAIHWNVVVDFAWSEMQREGVPRGLPPRIQVNSLRNLTLHCVVARYGLRIRGCPIPPLEVSESILGVAARKLGNDVLTDACGSILPIFAKSSSNLMVY